MASSSKASASKDVRVVSIENTQIALAYDLVPIADVQLDGENPRIQHAVKEKFGRTKPTQEQLCSLILDMSGVSDLFKSVRDNGGLLDPVHIRADGRVAEGNCRVACYIKLHRAHPHDAKWRHIPALRLPAEVSERQVAILQGQFHVAGKNKWRAYEKAGHIHGMHTDLGMDAKSISKALGMQERVVTRLLEAFEFCQTDLLPKMKNKKGFLDKWSHVEEFFKNKELEAHRKEPENRKQFADLVAEDKIKGGADVRQLPKILKSRRATQALKKDGVHKAIKVVGRADPTADSAVFRKMKEMTESLKKMGANDLKRLQEEKKSKALLRDLLHAVNQVCQLAEVE